MPLLTPTAGSSRRFESDYYVEGYLMAKHARPDQVTATSSEEWLDGFDTFSVYQVFPAIAQLWQANLKTTSTPKKKRGRRKGR